MSFSIESDYEHNASIIMYTTWKKSFPVPTVEEDKIEGDWTLKYGIYSFTYPPERETLRMDSIGNQFTDRSEHNLLFYMQEMHCEHGIKLVTWGYSYLLLVTVLSLIWSC